MPLAPPAFQFYAGDFLVSTSAMSNAVVGAYVRLLCYQWTNGGVPRDPKLISRIVHENVGWVTRYCAPLWSKFVLGDDGYLRNPRLEDVRRKQLEFQQLQSAKGKKGGRPKLGASTRRTKAAAFSRLKPEKSSPISVLRSSVRTEKYAAAPHAPPVEAVEKSKSRERPKVKVL